MLRGAQYMGKAHRQPLGVIGQGTLERSPGNGNSTILWKVLRAENGSVNWMWRIGSESGQKTQAVKPVVDRLFELKDILRIADPRLEFILESENVDEQGKRHLRFKQLYNGVPVWKRDLYVHFDKSGEPVMVNGTYEPTPAGANVIPSVRGEYATLRAIEDLKASGKWAHIDPATKVKLHIDDPTATLVLFPENRTLRLAYEVDVHPSLNEHYRYFVDATSGEIMRRTALHCSILPTDESHPVGVSAFHAASTMGGKQMMPLAGFNTATGTDLNGATRNFRTYQHSDNQHYMVADLASFNAGGSVPPNDLKGGGLTLDLKNKDASNDAQLFHLTSSNNAWSDAAAVSAHANTAVCYEYYRSTFTRNAIDGKNGTIMSIVHVTENNQSMGNAYWNGKLMLYGDGDANFKPLAGSLDVAAHEMTHGVTGNSADLIYEFQSGALNESFSDVFGVFVDDNDLLLGEDVIQPGKGSCLRNLENPADPNALDPLPAHMNEFRTLAINQDNGGVHINSGIPNRAAGIIINALGRAKAQQIYYKALTTYLTRNSQFIDCRIACETAAKDLHGDGSAEMQAVSNAFATVGIGGPPSNPNEDDVPVQTGGLDLITFIGDDRHIGFIAPSTLQGGYFGDQAAIARVTEVNGNMDRCQLSAPRSGNSIWFVTPTGHLAFVDLVDQTNPVLFFPNLKIQQDGDIWNASISPDGEYVSLVSSYVDDPNIYIFDGDKIFTIPLLPETPDGGAEETIQYPDVMSWSPNKNDQRIAFDAYNEENFAFGGSVDYWSMYEINFTTEKIYSLVPSQPEGISIGNVTYSKTDPDMIAFNVIDGSSSDVWIGEFESGDIFALGLTNLTLGGNPLLDADRPSFSPNDRYICFTSAANKAICFFDGTNGQVSFLSFDQAVFNPHWFLFGGSADVKGETDHFFKSVEVVPSVTNGRTTVKFSVERAANVSIEVINMLGATEYTRVVPGTSAGASAIDLDLSALASGAYLVRVTDGEHQAFTKLVIE